LSAEFDRFSSRHLIASARRLSAAPFHNAVKSFEVRASLALLKKARGFERGNLFRNSRRNELVHAGSFFLTDPLDGVLQRPRQS